MGEEGRRSRRRRGKDGRRGKEEYKNMRKTTPCTYSTDKLPCFPIRCAQHMDNVAMDSNNQPGNVLLDPVWNISDRHNWLAVELEMKNYQISNTKKPQFGLLQI
jgi:hypothetical protein